MKTCVIWVLFVCLAPKSSAISDYTNQGLTAIPGNVICSYHMIFRYNSITSITSTDFRSCTGLKLLKLDFNKISHIASDAFNSCPLLYFLTLSGNPIQIFPYFPIVRDVMIWLSVQGTSISSTTWDGVVRYTRLINFYMSANNIGQLPNMNKAALVVLELGAYGISDIP